ncbi:MAG: hypothetical protein LC114_13920, partial [Bryobacterales bacterium]|nr:hypothetical protein [Bryobacterales bacterium]
THAIWDIEKQETWDLYWRLTKTHIMEYSRRPPRLFHTIGMAERTFGASDEDNLQRKLYVYRRTQEKMREEYPDTPLLIASWDLYGWWKNNDVANLLREFDPTRTLLLDYAADVKGRKTYEDWGVVGHFPWIFGIFHGYARNSDIHEDYRDLAPRIVEAAADQECRGLVVWSEISHNDTFMLEYLADNSWKPERPTPDAAIARYVASRYPESLRSRMLTVWKEFLPASEASNWTETGPGVITFADPQFRMLTSPMFIDLTPERLAQLKTEHDRIHPLLAGTPAALEALSRLTAEAHTNEMWRRDALDIARTIANRAILLALMKGSLEMEAWRAGKGKGHEQQVRQLAQISTALLDSLGDLLEGAPEFSMQASIERLALAQPLDGIEPIVNSHTEQTLKSNSENNYCRSHHYEMVRHLYPNELHSYWEYVLRRIDAGDHSFWKRPSEFDVLSQEHRDRFYTTPLGAMAPVRPSSPEQLEAALDRLALETRKLLHMQ